MRMKRHLKLLAVLLTAFLIIAGCGSDNDSNSADAAEQEDVEQSERTDTSESESSEDETETNEDEDYRIVATTVALVEIMDALDLDLVGIPTSYKDLPARYDGAVEVGMAAEPDMEIIKSLNPTEVLSATTLDAEFDLAPVFENANVPVNFVDIEGIDNMYDAIHEFGEQYNRTEQAEQIIADFDKTVAEIEEKVAGQDGPSVLILLGVPGSYLVATENSYLGDLVKRVGGVNVFPGEDGVEYSSANTEYLQQTNPDVILRAAHGMPDAVVEMFDEEFVQNDIWQHFKAVQDDRVYDLEEVFGTTASLAVGDALDHLVKILYPELE